MTTQLSTIQFHNQSLVTFEQNGIYYTAMKPICENIGLAWNAQLLRIKRDEVLSQGMIVMIIPSNGGDQEMVCLPIDYLNGWLFGIDVKRVKPEIRDTLIMYKKECYKALADYWIKGKAERKTTTDERTGLRQAVSALVSKKGLIYSEAYPLIHQRFNVEHIDELTPEQIGMAVEYVHKIALEGEWIIGEPKSHTVEIPHAGRWLVIVDKYDPRRNRIKDMSGCNFVDTKLARQLLGETHQMADLLLELSKRMRLIDGYYEDNFSTPLMETKARTII